MPIEQYFPARRNKQRGKHLDRRRLTRAVRPEERENLPFRDIERDIVHGREIAELFHQMLDLNDR